MAIRRHAVATILGGLAAATIAFVVFVVTDAGASGAYRRPTPPAPIGVFRDGGVPARDGAMEAALVRLEPDAAFAKHGGALADAWRDMLVDLAHWRALAPSDAAFARASAQLHARVDVVTDQLAAAGLGYYLDAELPITDAAHTSSRRPVGIFAYRIDDIAFVRAGEDRVRVLGVRHLDADGAPAVHDGAPKLGMKLEELADPIVLLDAVDDKVSAQIVPVLAGAPFPLGDAEWMTARGHAAAAAAGDAIRAELLTALGTDVRTTAAATARCRVLLAASVRHHEAQHALDEDRGLSYPTALEAYVGEAKSTAFATRARFELSAYLSQVASDVWLPQLVVWNLARHGFRDAPTRTEEQLVAIVVVEGLARKLGIASPGPVIHNGAIDRDRLAALVAPIAARSTAELRSAAAALWAELFGGKLVRLVDL